jgi:hypothetical protein
MVSSKYRGIGYGSGCQTSSRTGSKTSQNIEEIAQAGKSEKGSSTADERPTPEAIFLSLSLNSHRQERRLLKNIGAVRKKAGAVRDMDVLISYVPSVRSDGAQECRVRLLENLGSTRRKKAKKLRAVASSKGQQARSGLKRIERYYWRGCGCRRPLLLSPLHRRQSPA